MIASTIGKTFLKAYNEKYKTEHTAKSLFEEVFFELFYNDEKYLQWVTNSPFVQGIKKGNPPNKEERLEKLKKLKEKINAGATDASVAIGYSSTDILASTSGQVSNLKIKQDEEELYASWIGGGFGIGVKGGFSFYINKPEVLMLLFEGWSFYRNFLSETPKLRPNQIDTWNGQWLAHVTSKRFITDKPLVDFEPFKTAKEGVIELETQLWVKIIFGLARILPNQTLNAYIFSLGQTNKTVGFIPIILPKIRKPLQLYKKLFGESQYLKYSDKIEHFFGNKNSFYLACERGAIGVSALQPYEIKQLLFKPDKKLKYDATNEDHVVSFQTYITWILVMLNNEDLFKLSEEITQLFLDYESTAERGKTTKSNAIKKLLESKSSDGFLNELLKVTEQATSEESIKLLALIEEVNKLRNDNFKRFLILLKLQYTIKTNSN